MEFRKQRILSPDLKNHVGQVVTIMGWLYKKREMGGLNFLIIRDRGGLIQALVEDKQEIQKLDGLQIGTVVRVSGKVVEEIRASGGVELHDPILEVEVAVSDVPPIEVDKAIDHNPENFSTLFDNRVLNMRNVTEQGIFKIQSGVADAIREYLKSQDFTEFRSPKLLPGSTEGGAEVFKLDYFGKEATLAQSAQFYKQIMVGAFERAFEFGATYRAEPSMTTRHMTEFTTVDVEMGFIEGVEDLYKLLGKLINYVVEQVWQKYEKELTALKAEQPILTDELPQITMNNLHELYLKETGKDFTNEKDPSPEEERFISEYSAKNWGSEAVLITDFPSSDMKFYHHVSEKNPEVVDRADLIFRGVEIVTVTRREHRYERLIEQLKAIGGNPEHPGFKYYLQAFKYGMPSHGGFGLGLERLTQKIIGLGNVKEATLFPRDTNRLAP